MEWNLGLMDTSNIYFWDTNDLVVFQAIFGVIRCTCLKMAFISKRAGRRAKRSEIWDSWTLITHVWGTFDLVGFKVILGWFGALVSKCPISQKTAGHRAKRSEIWDSGTIVINIQGTFGLVGSRSFWGHSVHLSQNALYLKKRPVVEPNGEKFGTDGHY